MTLPRSSTSSSVRNPDSGFDPARASRRRRIRFVALVAALICAIAATFVLSFSGQANDSPAPLASLAALRTEAGTLIVYAEYGEWSDAIWAADPANPTRRVQIATVDHAFGFGIRPSLSPDGKYVAYAAVPRDAAAGASAGLWLLDVETGAAAMLTPAIDQGAAPVWLPQSDGIVVRRFGAEGFAELVRVDLAGNATALAASQTGIYAIDAAPDGDWLYYAELSAAGTSLSRAALSADAGAALSPNAAGQTEQVALLSDGFSRDWRLSPDGSQIVYLARDPSSPDAALATQVLELGTGATRTLISGDSAGQFNPVWDVDGGLTLGFISPGGAAGPSQAMGLATGFAPLRLSSEGESAGGSLPPPASGFDVPLSWSADMTYLAVRNFEGSSGSDPGASRVIVVSPAGGRLELSRQSDVTIAGWLGAGWLRGGS